MTAADWEIVVLLESIAITVLGLLYRKTRKDYWRLAELAVAYFEVQSQKEQDRGKQQ